MRREAIAQRVAAFIDVVSQLEVELGRTLGVWVQGGSLVARVPADESRVRAAVAQDPGIEWSLTRRRDASGEWFDLGCPLLPTAEFPSPRAAHYPRGPGARLASWLVAEREAREVELGRLRREADERDRNLLGLYGQLDARATELEERDRQKTEFIAMLAHEVRNPLGAMDLALEALTPALDAVGPEARDAHAVLERQLRHLARMMDDVLDVSRLSLGTTVVRKEPLDLQRPIESAIRTVAPRARDKGVRIEADLGDAPIAVTGDETRLEQVVLNLVDNAVKYTPGGGAVRVSLGAEDGVPLATLRVEDDGVGMSAAQLREAFEPFVQHHQKLDRSVGGLGLGLTLVRQLVELHGGNVRAARVSEDGGTRFEVRLPLASAAEVSSVATPVPVSAEPRAERVELQGVRLMLVEDKDDFRTLLARQLGKRGAQVVEAGSADDALTRLREDGHACHAVVADVGLPGMSGFELAEALRRDPANRDLLLVALTGYGGAASRRRAKEAGFDLHLVKPVRAREVARALQERLATTT